MAGLLCWDLNCARRVMIEYTRCCAEEKYANGSGEAVGGLGGGEGHPYAAEDENATDEGYCEIVERAFSPYRARPRMIKGIQLRGGCAEPWLEHDQGMFSGIGIEHESVLRDVQTQLMSLAETG